MSRTNPFTSLAAGLQPVSVAEEECLLPRVLPAGWIRHPNFPGPVFDCVSMTSELRGVRVLFSAGIEEDGRKWIHVSLSRADRIPSWEDVVAVKRIFIGDARFAYQVIPPQDEHYDITNSGAKGGRAGKVLHLFAPVEGEPPLPNFLRARGGTL